MAEFIGDNSGITFYCDLLGRMQYTSTNLQHWEFTKVSFRATTTTV